MWAGCGPSGLSMPQQGSLSCAPPWHGAPPSKRVASCVPNNVSFHGSPVSSRVLPAPCSCHSLSWGAMGSPGCLWTYFYIKTGVGAGDPVIETDKYLTECYHGTYDFAATLIIIKVSFQLSSTTAFPRHKGKGLCWGQENNI